VSCSLAGTADATTRPPLDAIQGPRSRRLQALLTSVLGPAKPVGVVHLVQPCPGGQPADLQQLPQVVLFGPIGVVTTYSVSPSSPSTSLPLMLLTSATSHDAIHRSLSSWCASQSQMTDTAVLA